MKAELTDPDNPDLEVRIRERDAGSGNVCITEEEEKRLLLKVTSMKLFEEHRFSPKISYRRAFLSRPCGDR